MQLYIYALIVVCCLSYFHCFNPHIKHLIHRYYANYKAALVYQLDQRKPDLLECLSPPVGE